LTLIIAYFYISDAFEDNGPLKAPINIIIKSGSSASAIAQKLSRAGVISDSTIFSIGVWLHGSGSSLKAGEYRFGEGISSINVMKKLVTGDVIERKVTFSEGMTVYSIIHKLMGNDSLSGSIMEIPIEGSLLPETYSYRYGDKRSDLVKRMQQAMISTAQELWSRRPEGLPYNSISEAKILASIIEMEAGSDAERELISGVFVNRLRLGMRLQADPTVLYAITQGKQKLERKLTSNDLKIVSPFNTYLFKGLPPHPITNPGRASLKAAINPAKTEAIYFVSDGKGGHRFARTLSEHNKNISIWRNIQKKGNSY
tara:strand:+ start:119539 stop:120477 length:939 start_codon:yes stop_codon:yes gene_type:complete